MIPQRVAIEGFLSYRECVEFFFDDASIWMLMGENGAGKSSVFDAITFALYGVHRGGEKGVEELINRRSDQLAVEFDFLLGDDCYRVRRTLARSGRPTYQATHLRGPNSPNRNRTGAQPVPGTDNKAGLNQWVQEQIGLDSRAFKMSVLLEQGKSDALLSAEPKARHELLSRLVDLSRYEALEKRAKELQAAARESVQRCQSELALLQPVTGVEIAAQEACVAAAKKQMEAAQQRLEQLQALMVYAERWSAVSSQRDETSRTLEKMYTLIAGETTIAREAQRLTELQQTVPVLRRVLQHGEIQVCHQQEACRHRQNAEQLAAQAAELTPQWEEAQQHVAHLQQAREAAQSAANDALQQLATLTTPIHQLEMLAKFREQMARSDEALASFAEDLDNQLAAAQGEVDELLHLKSVAPYLQQYVAARTNWQAATTQLAAARQQQEAESQRVEQAAARLEAAQAEAATARAEAGSAHSRLAVARHDLQAVQEQVARFEEIGREPECPYCGQTLSQEHLAGERMRWDKALAAKVVAEGEAAEIEAAAQRRMNDAEGALKAAKDHVEAARTAEQQSHLACQRLSHDCERAEQDGWQALAQARENHAPLRFLPQVPPQFMPQEHEIVRCFSQPEPTTGDLAALDARLGTLKRAQDALNTLRGSVAACERHRATREQLQSQLQPLSESYPEERAAAICSAYAAATGEKESAQSEVERISPLLHEARECLQQLEEMVRQAKSSQQEAAQYARTAGQLAAASQKYKEDEIAALPPAWQPLAQRVEPMHITQWQGEIASLAGAETRHEELRTARNRVEFVEMQLAQFDRDLALIPPDAQQPVALLQQEEAQARASQRDGQEKHQRAVSDLRALKERRQRIQELSATKRAAEKTLAHYTLLVKYLGRDYLQRFLLQQAERSIVTLANAVLDQCSGGTLSMELRPHHGDGGVQKAFDLMVENRITQTPQDQMLPAWLLSGSQRFRVAISLALGIGQYASHNGRRIESVIIDEGFGSLDRQGLRDMEEALRALSGMLGRIILVSHQDDFARAFPHRYAIELVDGASQARLVDESEPL